jgi:hypothetical protein
VINHYTATTTWTSTRQTHMHMNDMHDASYTSPSPHFITEFAHPGHIDLVRCPPRHFIVVWPNYYYYYYYYALFGFIFFLSILGHLCSIIRPWSWHSMWGMRRASNYIYNAWLVCEEQRRDACEILGSKEPIPLVGAGPPVLNLFFCPCKMSMHDASRTDIPFKIIQ